MSSSLMRGLSAFVTLIFVLGIVLPPGLVQSQAVTCGTFTCANGDQCCATNTTLLCYNPATTYCCEQRVTCPNSNLCCGSMCYDPNLYTCCGPSRLCEIPLSSQVSCGTIRCPVGDRCCNTGNTSVCYNPTLNSCCQNRLVCAATDSCCGGVCYDTNQYRCCGNGVLCQLLPTAIPPLGPSEPAYVLRIQPGQFIHGEVPRNSRASFYVDYCPECAVYVLPKSELIKMATNRSFTFMQEFSNSKLPLTGARFEGSNVYSPSTESLHIVVSNANSNRNVVFSFWFNYTSVSPTPTLLPTVIPAPTSNSSFPEVLPVAVANPVSIEPNRTTTISIGSRQYVQMMLPAQLRLRVKIQGCPLCVFYLLNMTNFQLFQQGAAGWRFVSRSIIGGAASTPSSSGDVSDSPYITESSDFEASVYETMLLLGDPHMAILFNPTSTASSVTIFYGSNELAPGVSAAPSSGVSSDTSAIIGGVVGGVAGFILLLVLIGVISFLIVRKFARSRSEDAKTPSASRSPSSIITPTRRPTTIRVSAPTPPGSAPV